MIRFLRCSPFDEYMVWKRWVDNKSSQGTQRMNELVKTLLLRRTKVPTALLANLVLQCCVDPE